MIDRLIASDAAASMLIVPPQSSFHCVDVSAGGDIKEIAPIAKFPIWVNGGYFVLTQEIFDLIPENGDLVGDACMALAGTGRLLGYQHEGFWKPADTFKERAELDADYNAEAARGWCGNHLNRQAARHEAARLPRRQHQFRCRHWRTLR